MRAAGLACLLVASGCALAVDLASPSPELCYGVATTSAIRHFARLRVPGAGDLCIDASFFGPPDVGFVCDLTDVRCARVRWVEDDFACGLESPFAGAPVDVLEGAFDFADRRVEGEVLAPDGTPRSFCAIAETLGGTSCRAADLVPSRSCD